MIRVLHSLGINDGEIYREKTNSLNIEYANNKIKSLVMGNDEIYAVRVYKDKKLGFSFSNNLKDAVENAKKLSRYSENIEFSFSPPKKYKTYKTYDKKLLNIEVNSHLTLLKQIIDGFEGFKIINIMYNVGNNFLNISNTSLLNAEGIHTYNSIYAAVSYEKGLGSFYYHNYKLLDDLSFYIEKAKEEAKLNNEKIKLEKKLPIIFSQEVLHEFLSFLLHSFKGEENGKKRTKIYDKINKKIFDDKLSIKHSLSDPIPNLFDDEGIPSEDFFLVEKGIVKRFIYNRETALKYGGIEGNCVRKSYECKEGFFNIIINKGNENVEEYDHIFINSVHGLHTANEITGDFSVSVNSSYVCTNGNKRALKPFMISGNIFKLFNNIILGKEYEIFSNLKSPKILFKNIELVV